MSEQSKYAPVPGKIPGTAINLGGRDLILAPLNLDGMKIAEPLLHEYGQLKAAADVMPAAATIVQLSLLRNYPDITVDDVLALLDGGNVQKAVLAVFDISGVQFAKPGEIPPAAQ